jgi:endonuclease-3
MRRLQAHGLTIKSIQITSEEQLAELIHPVSFFNTKAKNIKKVTNILAEKYNYDTPSTYEEVLGLPGIGPKMALLFMYHVNTI